MNMFSLQKKVIAKLWFISSTTLKQINLKVSFTYAVLENWPHNRNNFLK